MSNASAFLHIVTGTLCERLTANVKPNALPSDGAPKVHPKSSSAHPVLQLGAHCNSKHTSYNVKLSAFGLEPMKSTHNKHNNASGVISYHRFAFTIEAKMPARIDIQRRKLHLSLVEEAADT